MQGKLRQYYLTGKQAHTIVKAMDTEFDQIEAACAIYPRLVEPAQVRVRSRVLKKKKTAYKTEEASCALIGI